MIQIAKDRERLAVGKQTAQRFDRQRFNLRKLNELEVRKQIGRASCRERV